MTSRVARAVRNRANHRCEYCLFPDGYVPMPFEIEHIISIQHGGGDEFENLALACLSCNRHKGSNLAGIDRSTSQTKLVRLFHPRRHLWKAHFLWDGPRLIGRTAIGRVTITVLNMNSERAVSTRQMLMQQGLFFEK